MRKGIACLAGASAILCLACGAALSAEDQKREEPAAVEFKEAVELIKEGNEALNLGDEERAYDLYDAAITGLNGIKGKYPKWKRDTVMKQIKLTVEAKKRLEEKTTQSLEEMKQGRFRYLVWQRQREILKRLSELKAKLAGIEEELDQNQEMIKDIRQRIGD